MTDLSELIEQVQQATGPDRELDCLIAVHCAGFFELPPRWEGDPAGYGYIDAEGTHIHPGHGGDQLVRRYTASLDAISTLIEQKLPGWHISIFGNHMTGAKGGKGWRVQLQSPVKAKPDALGYRWPKINAECFYAPTAPLALCLAFLLALQSQEQNND